MKPLNKSKSIAGAREAEPEDNEVFISKVRRPAEPELKPVNFPAVRVSPPERQERAFNIRVPSPADGLGMKRYVEREDQIPRRDPEPPATPVYERYPGLVREASDPERGKGRNR
jgi:hypothetical protein